MPTSQLERRERPKVSTRTLPQRCASLLVGFLARARAFSARHPAIEPVREPYEPGVTPLTKTLLGPALVGFFSCVAIVVGASQPASPFTLKLAGSWFFGIPALPKIQGLTPPPSQGLFLGVVLVYGGMVLLLRAWYDIVRVTSRYRSIPVSRLVPVFIAWTAPLLLVAPLFSHDLYSYAALGEMVTHSINPYHFGPSVLGSASPFNILVDPLWRNVPTPYGPLFLLLDGGIVAATGHSVLVSVVGLRLLALAGVVAFSVGVVRIARSMGRDGAAAFALAALNPLVLLHLIAGGHNDALMLGFLVLGYAFAREGRPIVGIILCGLGAAVKVPALIGAIYIGWEWLGTGRSLRDRIRPVGTALALAVGVMAALSEAAGLGWGWINGLSNPDTVRSWLDPATGIGLLAGKIIALVGLGDHTHILLTLARGSALLAAAVIALLLLMRSEEIGSIRALGFSLNAIVVLSPVIQPWYAAWGFVVLAPIAQGRVRQVLVVVSGISCFLGLPGGRVLVDELGIANPVLVGLAAAALLGVGTIVVYPKLRKIMTSRGNRNLVPQGS